MTPKDAPPEAPAGASAETWKALLGRELTDPHPERAGPAAAAGPDRGRR